MINTIELDILSPHVRKGSYTIGYVEGPSLMINIDGSDLFTIVEYKKRYEGANPYSFLYDEYINYESPRRSAFRGLRLIGVCNDCRCEGCDDLIARIKTDEKITSWKIIPDRMENGRKQYSFDREEYKEQIEKLTKKYYSYSWEDNTHRIRRLCSEYIKDYTTKDFRNIGVQILGYLDSDELSNTMTVYYYDDFEPMGNGQGRPFVGMNIKWDGNTLESAMDNLKTFSEKELIKKSARVHAGG